MTDTRKRTTKKTPEETLEERKVRALEKIANSLDSLAIWFEEVDKDEWDARIQFYLHKWYKNTIETDGDRKESD